MAQTRKRRRKKRRGTQSGKIETRRSRPRSRQEAKARARSNRKSPRSGGKAPYQRGAPTWRGAVIRAAVAAGVFFVLLMLAFKRPAGEAIGISVFMFGIYIPFGYYFDRFLYNRRQAAARRKREQAKGG